MRRLVREDPEVVSVAIKGSEKEDLSVETPSPAEHVALPGKNNMRVGPVRADLPNVHINMGIRNLHKADASSIGRQGWAIGILKDCQTANFSSVSTGAIQFLVVADEEDASAI